jgi:hypothetical protein
MIYIVIGFLFFFNIFIFENNNRRSAHNVYWFECVTLILLAGLRNSVGGDTIGYMMFWDGLPTFTELSNFNFILAEYQPLWYCINALSKYIDSDFTTFQIIHAAFVNISVFIFIKRYSYSRFTAILAYYLISFLYFNCEILRESLAISVFLFAVPSLKDKKWIKYYLLCLIAFLFHSSAIILFFLPFVRFIYGKKISLKKVVLSVIILNIILNPYSVNLVATNIFPFLRPLVETYSDWEWSLIGLVVAVIKCVMLGLLVYLRQRTKIFSMAIDGGLKLYLFFALFAIFLPIGQRFQNYFVIFFIVAFADFLWQFRGVNLIVKNLIIVFFVSTTIHYYYRDTSEWTGFQSRFVQLFYPYYSVFEEVPAEDLNVRRAIYFQEGVK